MGWWLVDHLHGDAIFEWLRPMIPDWAVSPSLDKAMSLGLSFGPPILLIALGAYFLWQGGRNVARSPKANEAWSTQPYQFAKTDEKQQELARFPPVALIANDGKISFDYSTNNGVVTVGEGDCLFRIAFSGSSNKNIQLMSSGRTRRSNLRKIARVRAVPPGSTLRFHKYDSTLDVYRIGIGETFLAENEHGFFMQGKIIDVQAESHGSNRDEVTFQFQINTNGRSEFISL